MRDIFRGSVVVKTVSDETQRGPVVKGHGIELDIGSVSVFLWELLMLRNNNNFQFSK